MRGGPAPGCRGISAECRSGAPSGRVCAGCRSRCAYRQNARHIRRRFTPGQIGSKKAVRLPLSGTGPLLPDNAEGYSFDARGAASE